VQTAMSLSLGASLEPAVSHPARPSRYLAPTDLSRRWSSSKDSTPPVALPLPYALWFHPTKWNPDFPECFVLDGRVISAFASTPTSDILVSEFTCGLNLSCWHWIPHSPPCLARLLSPYWASLQTIASHWHHSSAATSRPGERLNNRW
jgi:hypothetical protein